jgi:hypothetical protein
LHLLTIVSSAALLGFLVSVGLLRVGLRSMAVRYVLAALAAYAAFLVGLRLWLLYQRRRKIGVRRRRGDVADLSDLVPLPDGSAPAYSPEPAVTFGGGGGFSGAGAGGPIGTPGAASAGHAAADGATALDEGAVYLTPFVIGSLLVAGLIAAVAVVLSAPSLLAEVLLDGLIAGTAYRRLRAVPTEDWVAGVVGRTWKPMLAVGAILVAMGAVAQWLRPTADSIGDLLRR